MVQYLGSSQLYNITGETTEIVCVCVLCVDVVPNVPRWWGPGAEQCGKYDHRCVGGACIALDTECFLCSVAHLKGEMFAWIVLRKLCVTLRLLSLSPFKLSLEMAVQ
jgi:hypothetical protein